MAVRQRRVDVGAARGALLVAATGHEFMAARMNSALSQDDVSRAVGISRPQYGRIERGISPEVSIATIARIAAVLGLEASLRFYPAADPIRDAAHRELLERLRVRLHESLRFRTEVPFPASGDRRAWDAVIEGFAGSSSGAWRRGAVEAETRPTDAQALERKLALKERDGRADWLVLLLADTRHNRAFLAGPGAALRVRFPLEGRRALELLAAGANLGSNAIILL
jgi:transcriptional regulator with XRE-family HTH domain